MLDEFKEVLIHKTKYYISIHQAILNLHDISVKSPAKLNGESFDYSTCFDKDGVKFEISRTSFISSIIAYLFYDYEMASKLMKVCKKLKDHLNSFLIPIYYFYNGLIASAMAGKAKNKETFIKTIKEDILYLKRFVNDAPANYLHKVHFLEAELAVLCEDHSEAKSNYQKAILLCKKNRFANEEAMACERYAIFFLKIDSQEDATKLLLQSYSCYEMWNASNKSRHLVQKYPLLKDALKDSTTKVDKCNEIFESSRTAESISVLSNISSASINTWDEQNRA